MARKKIIEEYNYEDPRFGWMLYAYDEYDINDGVYLNEEIYEKFIKEANPSGFDLLAEYKAMVDKYYELQGMYDNAVMSYELELHNQRDKTVKEAFKELVTTIKVKLKLI